MIRKLLLSITLVLELTGTAAAGGDAFISLRDARDESWARDSHCRRSFKKNSDLSPSISTMTHSHINWPQSYKPFSAGRVRQETDVSLDQQPSRRPGFRLPAKLQFRDRAGRANTYPRAELFCGIFGASSRPAPHILTRSAGLHAARPPGFRTALDTGGVYRAAFRPVTNCVGCKCDHSRHIEPSREWVCIGIDDPSTLALRT